MSSARRDHQAGDQQAAKPTVAARATKGPDVMGQARFGLPGRAIIDAHTAMALQRSAGNAAVTTLLQREEDDEQVTRPSGPLTWHPSESFTNSYLTPPTLQPPASLRGAGEPDWGSFSEGFRNRNLTLGEGDARVVGEHYQRWLPLANALHGIPGVSHFYKNGGDLMNTLTGSMIDTTLSGDNPNAFDRFNRDDERYGVKTTTKTLKEWRF